MQTIKNWPFYFDRKEFKAAAATWYSDKVAIDVSSSYHLACMIGLSFILQGIPMFCGMIFEHYLDFAGNVVSGHAYNFLLSDDHSRLEYFEWVVSSKLIFPIINSPYIGPRIPKVVRQSCLPNMRKASLTWHCVELCSCNIDSGFHILGAPCTNA